MKYTVEQAQAIFEQLVENVHKGHEVLIQDGDAVVRLEPIRSPKKRARKKT